MYSLYITLNTSNQGLTNSRSKIWAGNEGFTNKTWENDMGRPSAVPKKGDMPQVQQVKIRLQVGPPHFAKS